MNTSTPDFDELVSRLKRYAAVAGSFNPGAALKTVLGDDTPGNPILLTRLLSTLAPDCIVDRHDDGDLWTMRIGPRHQILEVGASVLDGLDQLKSDPTVAMLADALNNSGEFAREAITARLEANDYERERVEQLIRVLDRAGPAAPGFSQVEVLKSLHNFYTRLRRTEETLQIGFVGRGDEISSAMSWIASGGSSKGALQTLHITGLPGIGKSFLLERIIQLVQELDFRPILVRLDFDRSALRVDTPAALFFEISRQIAEDRPKLAIDLRNARVNAIENEQDSPSRQREIPRELFDTLIRVLNEDPETRVVFILDTLEALRAQGDTHVSQLFEHLDMFDRNTSCDLRIVSAGRADALALERARIAETISLDGLEDWAARKLLEERQVPEMHWHRILTVAKGIPLRLVLAGKAAVLGAFDDVQLPDEERETAIEGYLYRAILSRVPKRIRRVANEGLIVHRMNTDVLREVVAPAIGLEISPEDARDILDELQRQHWLVKNAAAGDGDWIMHRDDIRATVLDLVYKSSPKLTAEIDRRAAHWFTDRQPEAALYHSLQMVRHGAPIPEVPSEIAVRFTDPMLSDLLPEAADAVLQARGERSGFGRAGTRAGSRSARARAESRPARDGLPEAAQGIIHEGRSPIADADLRPASSDDELIDQLVPHSSGKRFIIKKVPSSTSTVDSRVERDLEIMLERNDLREAAYVLSQGVTEPVAPKSRLGRLVSALQWRLGCWSLAESLFKLQRPVNPGEIFDLDFRPLVLSIFEMWAEYRFDDLVHHLQDRDLFDQVMNVLHSSEDTGLSGGALGFALIAAAPEGQLDGKVPQYLRTETAAVAPSLNQPGDEMNWRVFEAADSRRKSAGIGPGLLTSDGAEFVGRRLAPLNPYTVPILERIRVHEAEHEHSDTVLLKYLQGLYANLPKVVQLSAPDLQGLETTSERGSRNGSEIAALLADMGLTAHWAGAFRYAHRTADLPMLARAAERWRRTANGLWSYGGKKPAGWIDGRDCDWEMLAMRDHFDTDGQAEEALRFWSAPGVSDIPTLYNRMFGRLKTAGDRVREKATTASDTNSEFAAGLLAADVPLVLATPYSLLVFE